MKTVSAFLLFMSLLGPQQAFSSDLMSAVSTSDSIPQQERFSSQKIQSYLPVARQSITVKHSRLNQSGTSASKTGEILLPLGIIENSIVVKVGNTTLEADKDYTYLASGNRIRITDVHVLQLEEPIEISYETMRPRN